MGRFFASLFCALAFLAMSIVTSVWNAPVEAFTLFRLVWDADGDITRLDSEVAMRKIKGENEKPSK